MVPVSPGCRIYRRKQSTTVNNNYTIDFDFQPVHFTIVTARRLAARGTSAANFVPRNSLAAREPRSIRRVSNDQRINSRFSISNSDSLRRLVIILYRD